MAAREHTHRHHGATREHVTTARHGAQAASTRAPAAPVVSRRSASTFWMIWYMGEMPVPPATRPTAFLKFVGISIFWNGPLTCTVSPGFSDVRYLTHPRTTGTTCDGALVHDTGTTGTLHDDGAVHCDGRWAAAATHSHPNPNPHSHSHSHSNSHPHSNSH